MRYYEIFERDNRKIISSLRALIDHPNTEPALRDVAQRKLDKLLGSEEDRQADILATRKAKAAAEEEAARKAAAEKKAAAEAQAKADRAAREKQLADKAERDLNQRRAQAQADREQEELRAAYDRKRSAAELKNTKPTGKYTFKPLDTDPENEGDFDPGAPADKAGFKPNDKFKPQPFKPTSF
jgi:hypothetical protein